MRRAVFLLWLLLWSAEAWGKEIKVTAGELTLLLVTTTDGINNSQLLRTSTGRAVAQDNPLFEIHLSQPGRTVRIDNRMGWGRVSIVPSSSEKGTTLRWEQPHEKELTGLWVQATVHCDEKDSSLRWQIRAGAPRHFRIESVAMPELRLPRDSGMNTLFYPQGPGVVRAVDKGLHYRQTYPSMEATMQFVALHSPDKSTGLYAGFHDERASTKQIYAESDPSRTVRLGFQVPAESALLSGGDFSHTGQLVWRFLRGDWFDAALVYKKWVRAHARWSKRQLPAGKRVPWMAQTAFWATSADSPDQILQSVTTFAKQLSVPVAFHWYGWHRNPFDNDYPHFFPAKPEFAQTVVKLQQQGIPTVPYINARLWDTRDRGLRDFQFSKIAKSASAKGPSQQPITESYESKENDGSRVKFAVMCPYTDLWQSKVRALALRLVKEFKTQGVYFDQVAASAPAACMDPSHGHPLGGGHWWVDGYEQMIEAIRRQVPAGTALLSESNSEPYLHLFDGLLMWNWQEQNQVPAFSAVYGGAIPMFGRFFGNGTTRDLAFRMRLAQQLVFGEQLGWFNPALLSTKANAEFARMLASVRHQFGHYFIDGEMARPPSFVSALPKVRADWQWKQEHWVETDAVLSGAWTKNSTGRTLLLFVNVSDFPVRAELHSYRKLSLDLKPHTVQTLEIDGTLH